MVNKKLITDQINDAILKLKDIQSALLKDSKLDANIVIGECSVVENQLLSIHERVCPYKMEIS